MSRLTSAVDDAWQAALAAEHRAVFGYGLAGPRLDGDERRLAADCEQAHETARDDTTSALAAAGAAPVGPLAGYPELGSVRDAAAARRCAVSVEQGCAAAWRALFAAAAADGSAPESVRARAQQQLTASAVRAVRWRALVDPSRASDAFPGI
ncbi:ferritin family protein [Jatrophihabitans fulvus]